MVDVNIDLFYPYSINHGGQPVIISLIREEYRPISAVHGLILAGAVGKLASVYPDIQNLIMALDRYHVNSKSILIGCCPYSKVTFVGLDYL